METIRIFREQKGLSRVELAEKLCVHEDTVARYERGERVPSGTLIKQMAEIFGCTADELLK